jgi:hypothetical protein
MRALDHRRPGTGTVHVLAIRCPRCRREAAFEQPTRVLQGEEAKVAAADPSLTGSWTGRYFVVVRYPELLSWPELRRLRHDVRQLGIARCGGCGYLARHLLEWPAEAYYALSHRGRTLWMYTREHAASLRAYIASAGDRQRVPDARRLARVPKEFLAARNRVTLVKKLDRLLAEGPEPRAVPSRPDPRTPRPRR